MADQDDKTPEELEVAETATDAPTETDEVTVGAADAAEEELLTTAEADPAEADEELEEPEVTEEADQAAVAASAPPAPRAAPAPQKTKPAAAGEVPVVRAQAKYVRTSARKARLVCDHLRGKDVETARAILQHTPRQVAEAWSKLLESAVANAEHNHELVGDDLRILSIKADEGPTIKRFRPRAMGRATQIRKRTSHLTIELTPKKETR
jgi:ribosomal protein L22